MGSAHGHEDVEGGREVIIDVHWEIERMCDAALRDGIRLNTGIFDVSKNFRLTLDLKNMTKFAGSRGMSPDTINGLALAASKGGPLDRWQPMLSGKRRAPLDLKAFGNPDGCRSWRSV